MRTPSQVFELLETVFGAFDTLATTRSVYKVETVGDCYVAITGLPRAQPDHCLRMCRYAMKCMALFSQKTMELSVKLGADTADLKLRVGIHTGQVTAGVLRGDRARFALFGDTVNTGMKNSNGSQRQHLGLSNLAYPVLF